MSNSWIISAPTSISLSNILPSLTLKDVLSDLFHGFRNKYFNKISLENLLYFHK